MQAPYYPQQPAPPKKGMSTGCIVLLVLALVSIPVIGIFLVLGIYGTRKYIANAKTAEARNTLAQIGMDAQSAFERERAGSGAHKLCASASRSVPASLSMVSAKKYQSATSDWEVDKATDGGFYCLKFSMSQPQYYMYSYHSTPSDFSAMANGDLNGDGVSSTFELDGQVSGASLNVAPTIKETNPDE